MLLLQNPHNDWWHNVFSVIDQGEESKPNLRTIKVTATTKLQKSEVAVLIAAVKRAARNKHRLMDLSITKETKSRARSDETEHSQNLHSDEEFSEFSGRLSRTQVDRRKRLLYVDTSRPRPFYRRYPVDHCCTGATYERHKNKRLDVTSFIQPLEELVRNQLTKHLGLRRLSHAVTSGCLALPKALRHRLLTFSTSDFVEDRDEKEEDNDALKTSQSVGTFKVRCRHDNQAYQATFFTSEADKVWILSLANFANEKWKHTVRTMYMCFFPGNVWLVDRKWKVADTSRQDQPNISHNRRDKNSKYFYDIDPARRMANQSRLVEWLPRKRIVWVQVIAVWNGNVPCQCLQDNRKSWLQWHQSTEPIADHEKDTLTKSNKYTSIFFYSSFKA